MEQRILESETRQSKVIFPYTLNANNTLFGGYAMQWMDEVAYITATRFTRQKMYTAKVENVTFHKPIHPDSIIDIIGKIEKVEQVKLIIKVEIYTEDMYSGEQVKAIESTSIFVALNENLKPKLLNLNF